MPGFNRTAGRPDLKETLQVRWRCGSLEPATTLSGWEATDGQGRAADGGHRRGGAGRPGPPAPGGPAVPAQRARVADGQPVRPGAGGDAGQLQLPPAAAGQGGAGGQPPESGTPPARPRQYLRLEPRAAKAWRDVAGINSYSLRLTAGELDELVQALDAAIRPYIGLTRADPPGDAQPVHLDFKAFLRPEALA